MSVICQYLIFPICSLKSKEFSAKYLVIFLDKHINIQGEWAVREKLKNVPSVNLGTWFFKAFSNSARLQ